MNDCTYHSFFILIIYSSTRYMSTESHPLDLRRWNLSFSWISPFIPRSHESDLFNNASTSTMKLKKPKCKGINWCINKYRPHLAGERSSHPKHRALAQKEIFMEHLILNSGTGEGIRQKGPPSETGTPCARISCVNETQNTQIAMNDRIKCWAWCQRGEI